MFMKWKIFIKWKKFNLKKLKSNKNIKKTILRKQKQFFADFLNSFYLFIYFSKRTRNTFWKCSFIFGSYFLWSDYIIGNVVKRKPLHSVRLAYIWIARLWMFDKSSLSHDMADKERLMNQNISLWVYCCFSLFFFFLFLFTLHSPSIILSFLPAIWDHLFLFLPVLGPSISLPPISPRSRTLYSPPPPPISFRSRFLHFLTYLSLSLPTFSDAPFPPPISPRGPSISSPLSLSLPILGSSIPSPLSLFGLRPSILSLALFLNPSLFHTTMIEFSIPLSSFMDPQYLLSPTLLTPPHPCLFSSIPLLSLILSLTELSTFYSLFSYFSFLSPDLYSFQLLFLSVASTILPSNSPISFIML